MKSNKIRSMVETAVLTAIIILMAFTPLGYLRIGIVAVSLIVIPVAVGAVAISPAAGAFLGLVFGTTSFVQCFGMDPFGSMLGSISMPATAFVCFVPRILMGFLAGVIYKALAKVDKTKVWTKIVGCVLTPLFNTVLFMTSLMVLFGSTDYIKGLMNGANILAFVAAFVGLNGIIEILSCGIVGTVICVALSSVAKE